MPTDTITSSAPAQIGAAQEIYTAVFGRSGNFRIELDYDTVVDLIHFIGEWNDFTPENVLDALERIDRLIPRCPRNGERAYKISVGREGSPVLYLERYEFPWSEKLSAGTLQAICREMALFGYADDAEHTIRNFTVSQGRCVEFRFWWD